MLTNRKLQEAIKAARGFTNADISADRDSTVFAPVAGFREVSAVASCADVADTETMTLTLLQATDAAGTGKKVLGAARVATNSSGGAAPLGNVVSAHVSEMDHANGFIYVGARIVSDAAVEGQVVLTLSDGRHGPPSQDVSA